MLLCPLCLQEKLKAVVEGLEEKAIALDRTLSDIELEEKGIQVQSVFESGFRD